MDNIDHEINESKNRMNCLNLTSKSQNRALIKNFRVSAVYVNDRYQKYSLKKFNISTLIPHNNFINEQIAELSRLLTS